MAKVTMGSKKTRFKIQRRLGLELPGLGKVGSLERRPYPPGQHGARRKKISEYTVRLMEKQKVIFHYGLREKQLQNYIKKSKKVQNRPWVDALIERLEKRLDNVVFRMNWAPSMMAARQLVSHGHIKVNGERVNLANYVVSVGDKISLSTGALTSANYLQAQAKPRMEVPAFLRKDKENGAEIGFIMSNPLPEDIPFPFEKRLLIEYYWKIKN